MSASESRPFLKVVIVYDDLPVGKRAMRALDGSVRECAAALRFEPQIWRVDLLEDPNWREFATPDVVNADMVFIAFTGKNAIPEWFRGWLCACLSRKRETRSALVVLLDRGDASEAPVGEQLLWLEEAAREAGWDFFCYGEHENDSAPAPEPDRFEQSRLQAISTEVTTRFFFEQVNYAGYRYWGINE